MDSLGASVSAMAHKGPQWSLFIAKTGPSSGSLEMRQDINREPAFA